MAWRPANDPDDSTLTYNVYRDNGTTPIHTVTGDSWFWQRPQMTFLDPQPAGLDPHLSGVGVGPDLHPVLPPGAASRSPRPVPATPPASSPTAPTALWRVRRAVRRVRLATPPATATTSRSRAAATYQVTPAAIAGDPSRALTFGGASTTAYSERRFDDPNFYSLETWVRTTTHRGREDHRLRRQAGHRQRRRRPAHLHDRQRPLRLRRRRRLHGSSLQSAAGFNDGTWHHVVATQGSGGHVAVRRRRARREQLDDEQRQRRRLLAPRLRQPVRLAERPEQLVLRRVGRRDRGLPHRAVGRDRRRALRPRPQRRGPRHAALDPGPRHRRARRAATCSSAGRPPPEAPRRSSYEVHRSARPRASPRAPPRGSPS